MRCVWFNYSVLSIKSDEFWNMRNLQNKCKSFFSILVIQNVYCVYNKFMRWSVLVRLNWIPKSFNGIQMIYATIFIFIPAEIAKSKKKKLYQHSNWCVSFVHSHYIINCHTPTNMEISHLKRKLVGCFSPYLPQ